MSTSLVFSGCTVKPYLLSRLDNTFITFSASTLFTIPITASSANRTRKLFPLYEKRTNSDDLHEIDDILQTLSEP